MSVSINLGKHGGDSSLWFAPNAKVEMDGAMVPSTWVARPSTGGSALLGDLKSNHWPEPLLLPDLFEIPVPWSDEYLLKTWISMEGKLDCAWQPVFESVLCFPATLPRDGARFQHFRNGQRYVYTFDERQDEAPNLHINTSALGHYSYFFYLDEERHGHVVDLMKRLRPKRPYLEVADRIAASFRVFNAVHIRRGDFLSNDLSKMKITRAASISGQEVVANLASRMHRDDPLVISTDGSSREELFGPIQKYFHEVMFLDRYLHESASIREMISQLPHDDEAVLVLLTQLVASKAKVFAGTLFSTFTALIHRLRGFASQESGFLYCYSDFLPPLVRFERCEFLPLATGVTAGTRSAIRFRPALIHGSASGRSALIWRGHPLGTRCRPPECSTSSPAGPLCMGARFGDGRREWPRSDRQLDRSNRVRGLAPRVAATWKLLCGDAIRLPQTSPPAAITASASRERTSSKDVCGPRVVGPLFHRGFPWDGSESPAEIAC